MFDKLSDREDNKSDVEEIGDQLRGLEPPEDERTPERCNSIDRSKILSGLYYRERGESGRDLGHLIDHVKDVYWNKMSHREFRNGYRNCFEEIREKGKISGKEVVSYFEQQR